MQKSTENVLVSPKYREVLRKPADMIMTETDQKAFREATHCHICGEALVNDRV